MTSIALEETKLTLQDAVQLAQAGVLVLTRNGKPAFALVDIEDSLTFEALQLGRDESFMAYLDEAVLQAEREPTYSVAELREEYKAE